jgi:hypothetical protein
MSVKDIRAETSGFHNDRYEDDCLLDAAPCSLVGTD